MSGRSPSAAARRVATASWRSSPPCSLSLLGLALLAALAWASATAAAAAAAAALAEDAAQDAVLDAALAAAVAAAEGATTASEAPAEAPADALAPPRPSDGAPYERPHIILLVLDDVGRGDTSVVEPASTVGYATPVMERLARKDGVLLTNYYTQTVCTPTRAALLTGRFPFRMGLQHVTTIVPASLCAVPMSVPTLPEMLKRGAGYATHMVGKWHLGMASAHYTPTGRGFDTFFGYLNGQVDYYNKTLQGGLDFWDEAAGRTHYERAARAAVGNYSVVQYRDRVRRVIEAYAQQHASAEDRQREPLFLLVSHQTVHIPLEALSTKDKRCDKSGAARRVYCNMMVELDDAVGQMEAALRAANLWDNALVLATTDNGGMVPFTRAPGAPATSEPPPFPGSVGSNFPLRGSKTTLFEGGVRGLAFVTGGRVHADQRGKTYDGLAHAVDLAGLALRAARGPVPEGEPPLAAASARHAALSRWMSEMDGLPLQGIRLHGDEVGPLRGRERTVVPINVIRKGRQYSAVRFGKYKLVVGDGTVPALGKANGFIGGWWPPLADKDPEPAPPQRFLTPYLLFDLEADPTERVNLAHNLSHVVRQGKRLIADIVNSPSYSEPQPGNAIHLLGLPTAFNGHTWRPFIRAPRDDVDRVRDAMAAAYEFGEGLGKPEWSEAVALSL